MIARARTCDRGPRRRKNAAMGPVTSVSRLIVPVTALLVLSGCGDNSLSRTFGLVRDTPDEFAVVTRAPLSMPPNFTLRPPEPGMPRPQELPARAQAESVLVPEAVLAGTGASAGLSQGQAALIQAAGGPAPADIRQLVDHDARVTASDDSFVDKLLYWRKGDTAHAVVDPSLEAARLRQDAALGRSPVTGATPIIQERKKGWFQSLFGWL
jgi:Protein of unknown function (DUF3035)